MNPVYKVSEIVRKFGWVPGIVAGLVLVGISGFLLPGPVYGQPKDDPLYRSPTYLYGFVDSGGTDWNDETGNRDFFNQTSGVGGSIGIGLALNPHVSLEMAGVNEIKADYDEPFTFNSGTVYVKDGFVLRARFLYPISSFTRIYTELGHLSYYTETYENGFFLSEDEESAGTFGVGFHVQLGEQFALRFGTERFETDSEEIVIRKIGVISYFETDLFDGWFANE